MRRFFVSLTALVPVVLLSACGGNNAATGSLPAQTQAQQHFTVGSLTHMKGRHHTPAHRPKPTRKITGADVARARAGGWIAVSNVPNFPNGAGTEMLMTDGSVMIADNCSALWYSLAPDANGNYATGTWTAKAAPSYAPLYFASAILPDGKLIINGGEYDQCVGKETTKGAIYDPVANSWTNVNPPSGWSQIGDAQSVVLNDGTYMIGNCCTSVQAQYNESTGAWTSVGSGKHDANSEEGWTLLPNGTVLAADVLGEPNSEAFSSSTSTWSTTGSVGANLTAGEEIGPQTLRPNGEVWVAGANGLSASFSTKSGTWKQGPTFPVIGGQQLDVADGPSTVLLNGDVLIPASPGLYNAPSTFFIYNGKKLKQIAGPPNAPNDSSYEFRLLMLPNGQVLATDFSDDVEIYTSNHKAKRKLAPVISSVPTTVTHGQSYTVSGTKFNGSTQENFYGDDDTQATNFPLVRITNSATGHVFYARTHGFTFMGVAAPTQAVSATFDVPSGIETGASKLVVVTNGIASKPVSVTVN
jgi:hypothetical protein